MKCINTNQYLCGVYLWCFFVRCQKHSCNHVLQSATRVCLWGRPLPYPGTSDIHSLPPTGRHRALITCYCYNITILGTYKRLTGSFPTIPWCPHQGGYAEHHGPAHTGHRVDLQATGARGCPKFALHSAEGSEPCIQNRDPWDTPPHCCLPIPM